MDNNQKSWMSRLGYKFKDHDLLNQALTHRSFGHPHNERFEFLGDAILGYIVAEKIYELFPKATEGQLSRMRTQLVCGDYLTAVAKRLGVHDFIRLGPGEVKSGGAYRDSILENTLESLIAAIYIESGIEVARQVVFDWFADDLENLDPDLDSKDNKTRLQEILQGNGHVLPKYIMTGSHGQPPNEKFSVECLVDSFNQKTKAVSSSRRKAEQIAAGLMIKSLKKVIKPD